ncbi:MAG: tetratricopeptide repeat protein, partial [Acidobacteriota bacterium]|nr:tetratricopeptide repeat protein [Acidobacteriota bacterium]
MNCRTAFHFAARSVARNFFSVLFLLIGLVFAQSAASQKPDAPKIADAPPLELGMPLEGEIAAKEKRVYQITLAENQYAVITVEQRGIDVAVRVFNKTDDRAMVQRDLIANADGREEIGFTASTAGVYRLEIEAKMLPAVTGHYTALLAEVRPPTEKELRLEEARKLHNKSYLLWRAGKYAEAIPVAERALAIREQELGAEDLDVALSLVNLALVV